MIARRAKPGDKGIDTVTILRPGKLRELAALGYVFAVRYAPFAGSRAGAWDLTADELADIHAAGLDVGLVQRCRTVGWAPGQARGKADGRAAAAHAAAIGYSTGAHVWCDIEGVSPDVRPADILAHVNAWSVEVDAAGYLPGLYVGWRPGLTGDQLYRGLRLRSYWRSASAVPDVTTRGYCLRQSVEQVIAGMRVDVDVVQADHLGGLPIWCAADAAKEVRCDR